MFNFIGKKEKKSRKGSSASGEELESVDKLEEVRRSLKIRSGKRKEKAKLPSGITADYSSAFFAQLDLDRGSELDRGSDEVIAGNTTTVIDLNNGDVYERRGHIVTGTNSTVSATFLSHSDNSSENSINVYTGSNNNNILLPQVPPRPPKRGILKGSKTSLVNVSDSDSKTLLMRNTLQNERMGDEVRIKPYVQQKLSAIIIFPLLPFFLDNGHAALAQQYCESTELKYNDNISRKSHGHNKFIFRHTSVFTFTCWRVTRLI